MSEQPKPYFTMEEMVSLPGLSQLAIHPDGHRLAYVERRADWDENTYVEQVFVYDEQTGVNTCLTPDAVGGNQPRWSPDGKVLAYVRTIGEGDKRKPQVFVKSEGEATGIPLTDEPEGVAFFQFAPDGQKIYYLAVPPQKDRETRKETYGPMDYVDIDDSKSSLFVVDIAAARTKRAARFHLPKDLRNHEDKVATQLVDRADLHILDFAVSPQEETVYFTAAPSTNFEDFHRNSLYQWSRQSAVRQIPVAGVIGSTVLLSPDGKYGLLTRQTGDAKMFRNHELVVLTFGSEEERVIPLDIDENVYPVVWTQRGIVVEWQDRTEMKFACIQPDGQREDWVAEQGVLARGASVTLDGEHAAWIQATAADPWDIVLHGHRVTDMKSLYAQKRTSRKQTIHWTASDGVEIEGILSLPPDFEEGERYPLLLVVHGGPTAASLPVPTTSKNYPIEQFVEKGCLVLEPNYRGSSGYGGTFRGLNERNLGLGDYDDVISGVDALIERGYADADKVGVMGWSQGGYISAFCTTYSDRFKAVSVGAGISNWVTYYVNTDIHPFTRHYLGDTPWNDAQVYAKTSPMTYINNARTPTLIQHGDADPRVPVPNAFELYQGLRDVGTEVKLVIFKGMLHGSNKPGWNRAIMQQNLAWFSHYVLGEPLDPFWLK